MGQCWQLMNPFVKIVIHKRDMERQSNMDLANLGISLDTPVNLARLLAVPVHPNAQSNSSNKDIGAHKKEAAPGFKGCCTVAARTTATLPGLPAELLPDIFDWFKDIEDVVSLGLTCKAFWSIAQKEVVQYHLDILGEWAGQKIICLGSFIEGDDYPENLLEDSMWNEVRHSIAQYNSKDAGFVGPATLYDVSEDYSPPLQAFDGDRVKESSASILGEVMQRPGSLPDDPAFAATKAFFDMTEEDYYPVTEKWVLCNVTTKEFVRAEAIALEPGFVHGPHVAGIGLGTVVMFRSPWSSDSSSSIIDIAIPIHRGPWAGHQFEITTVARHESLAKVAGEVWTDVGQEVMREIRKIW